MRVQVAIWRQPTYPVGGGTQMRAACHCARGHRGDAVTLHRWDRSHLAELAEVTRRSLPHIAQWMPSAVTEVAMPDRFLELVVEGWTSGRIYAYVVLETDRGARRPRHPHLRRDERRGRVSDPCRAHWLRFGNCSSAAPYVRGARKPTSRPHRASLQPCQHGKRSRGDQGGLPSRRQPRANPAHRRRVRNRNGVDPHETRRARSAKRCDRRHTEVPMSRARMLFHLPRVLSSCSVRGRASQTCRGTGRSGAAAGGDRLIAADVRGDAEPRGLGRADPSQAGCGRDYGLRTRLFVVAGWGEVIRSVRQTRGAVGLVAGDGDVRVEPAEPAGPA